MSLCCFVKNCKSRHDHTQTTNLKFFGFPKDANIRQQWLNACGKNDTNTKIDYEKVCNLHFNEDCFEMKWTVPLKSNMPAKKIQRLKKDSIPTKMLNLEKRKIGLRETEKDVANRNKRKKVPVKIGIPTYTEPVQYMHKNQQVTSEENAIEEIAVQEQAVVQIVEQIMEEDMKKKGHDIQETNKEKDTLPLDVTKEQQTMDKLKRVVKRPAQFDSFTIQSSSLDEASQKHFTTPKTLKRRRKSSSSKRKFKVENDITEHGKILNNKNDNENEIDNTFDSKNSVNNTHNSSQRTSEMYDSEQLKQVLPECNPKHLTQSAPNNEIKFSSLVPFPQTPSQTTTNTLNYTSPNPLPQNLYCLPSTSSAQMPYSQHNIDFTPHINFPPSTQMPYDRAIKQQNIQNNNTQNARNIIQPNNASPINNQMNEARPALQPIDHHSLQERLNNIDAQLQRILNAVQNISKSGQKPRCRPEKPAVLPIKSMEEMVAFENIEEDTYFAVVRYFEFCSLFYIEDFVNMCLKEAMIDAISLHFSWQSNKFKKYFSKTRLVHAIYEAACNNAHFKSLTRTKFEVYMRDALRNSKQRHRNRQNMQQELEH